MSKTISKKEAHIQIAQLVKSRFNAPSIPYTNPFDIGVGVDSEKLSPPIESELKEISHIINNTNDFDALRNFVRLRLFGNEKS